jgi:N-acetylneuraminic acid mutarotase
MFAVGISPFDMIIKYIDNCFTRYSLIILFILPISLIFHGCKDDDDDSEDFVGNWIELSDFEGVPRSDAVGFTIGDKGYVGTGYDGTDRLNDFWEYDTERNTWMQKADFPGAARNGAVGFGTDTRGYIGTGYDGIKKLKDFWEFNPDSNIWVQKADFGGSARYGAVGFVINNKCYIGTGYDGKYLKDFWEYDPESDMWNQKVSVGGSKRKDAVGFVIYGKGYICTGINNGAYGDDFWEYDPATDTWTEKRSISNATDDDFDDDYTSITGINKTAFSIDGRAFIATGGQGSTSSIVWEYDPVADLWEQKTSFEGVSRIEAVSFTIGNRAYLTTGRSSGYYFDDIWAFEPDSEYDEYD